MPLNEHAQSAAQPGLAIETIADFPAPVPPPTEQEAITSFLDRETARIDALRAKKERLISLLDENRAALIDQLVMGAAESPSETIKLRRLLTPIRRPVEVDPESAYREIGIRSWGKGIFHKDSVKGALLEDKGVFQIKPGDLVFNIVFAWEGAVAVAGLAEEGMVGSHRFPTFLHDSQRVDLDYLFMFLQSRHGLALMALNSPGAAGRNRTIRLSSFMNEEIPLPTLLEQKEIVARFRQREARFAKLSGEIQSFLDRLDELRTALVSAAVTGQIDVRNES